MKETKRQTEKYEESANYYIGRMMYLLELFKSHETRLLNDNQDKIKNLVSEYKTKFFGKPNYDTNLALMIENFILD